jgi:hypothetical protein
MKISQGYCKISSHNILYQKLGNFLDGYCFQIEGTKNFIVIAYNPIFNIFEVTYTRQDVFDQDYLIELSDKEEYYEDSLITEVNKPIIIQKRDKVTVVDALKFRENLLKAFPDCDPMGILSEFRSFFAEYGELSSLKISLDESYGILEKGENILYHDFSCSTFTSKSKAGFFSSKLSNLTMKDIIIFLKLNLSLNNNPRFSVFIPKEFSECKLILPFIQPKHSFSPITGANFELFYLEDEKLSDITIFRVKNRKEKVS